MTIKAIIWDFAGVLLHTIRGNFLSLLAERLEVSQVELAPIFIGRQNDLWDLGEIDNDRFYNYVLQELAIPAEKKSVIANFMENDFYIQPELLAYIRSLRKDYTTILLTNFPTHLHKLLKTKWDISGAFDHLFASCDIKLLKPDPHIYNHVLQKTGFSAGEVVFIDDREVNIRGAKDKGIRSILYQDVNQVIADLNEILAGTSET